MADNPIVEFVGRLTTAAASSPDEALLNQAADLLMLHATTFAALFAATREGRPISSAHMDQTRMELFGQIRRLLRTPNDSTTF